MRMHRGSSKETRTHRASETLPLSAPPSSPATIEVTVEVARAGAGPARVLRVAEGTPVRVVVREAGLSPEGCAVLIDGTSVPRDLALRAAVRLVIVPTFSGG